MGHGNLGKKHLLMMIGLPVAIFLGLLITGRPAGSALFTAVVLACPLHMVMMMLGGHGQDSTTPKDHADELGGHDHSPLGRPPIPHEPSAQERSNGQRTTGPETTSRL